MSLLQLIGLSKRALVSFVAPRRVALCVALTVAASASAQDRKVLFDVDDPGVDKSLELWGLDTAWLWDQNVIRGVEFMGKPQVDVIRFSYTPDQPLVNGDLNATAQQEFDDRMAIVNNYTLPGTRLYMNPDGTFDAWYKDSNGKTIADRIAQIIDVTRQKMVAANRTLISVAPFNEPDFGTAQGDVAKLGEISNLLRNDAKYKDNFKDIRMCTSALNDDVALNWYLPIKDVMDEGNTHQLAGDFDHFAAFFQTVRSNGGFATDDELHNVMEAMVGAEYGMQAGIWWGTAEYARGEFVKASDGMRLGYAEHRPNWTAASVYRAPSGKVQAFVGESERQARPTTFMFVSKDRDVYFDGQGPQRTYSVNTSGGTGYQTPAHKNAEHVINISWGDDVQPEINGRYTIVNRQSGKVMEVEGGSADNGANIRQWEPNAGDNQSWQVKPLTYTSGGDWSYYTIKPFSNSAKTIDVWNWNLDAGADVRQYDYGGGTNQQWILEYVEDGYFRIRNRFSGKYLEVAGGSSDSGANIQMAEIGSGHEQQWRLVPADGAIEFDAPTAPSGLLASANSVSVSLSWNANAESDLKGYNVYRSMSPDQDYELIARSFASNAFTDKAANQAGVTYYYRIKAADKSLNVSAHSDTVSATPKGGDALVAALEFENSVSDSSGNANDVVTGSAAAYVEGKQGVNALYFNGATYYANLPATVANFDRLTVAAWVYWSGGTDNQPIFDFGTAADARLYLTPKTSGGGLRFVITNGGVQQQVDAPSALTTGSWTHVAIALGDGSATLFVDGAKVGEAAVSLRPSDIQPVLNYIGKSQVSSDPVFKGRIDDFRIYNYALSREQVASAAQLAAPPAPAHLAGGFNGSAVELTWDSVPGASRYAVKRSDSSSGPFTLVAGDLQANAYSDADLSGAATRYYVVTATNDVGEGVASSPLEVSILTPAEEWRLAHFGATDNAGDGADDADPDGDLVSNLLERAFGGDPKVAERDLWPIVDDSERLLSVVYRRSKSAPDLDFTVEENSDLSTAWIPSAGTSEVVEENEVYQLIRFTRVVDDDDTLFLRVKVTTGQ